MPPWHRVLEFALVAAAVIAVPGPSVLFTISRALTVGRRAALFSVVGNELGEASQMVATAFGIGALIESSQHVFTVVKLVGAAYLVFLGVQAVRHRRDLAGAVARRVGSVAPRRAVRDGFVVGVSNPKTIAFFLVALPEFADRRAGHLTLQFLVLGALFSLIALVLDSIWAIAAGTMSEWLSSSPRRLAAVGGAGGLVMIGLGLTVATTGRHD